jgi:hypothetical protein
MIFNRVLKESIDVAYDNAKGLAVKKMTAREIQKRVKTLNPMKGLALTNGNLFVWVNGRGEHLEHRDAFHLLQNAKIPGVKPENLAFTFYADKEDSYGETYIDLATPSNEAWWWKGHGEGFSNLLNNVKYTPETAEMLKKRFPLVKWFVFDNAIVDATNGRYLNDNWASSLVTMKRLMGELRGLR